MHRALRLFASSGFALSLFAACSSSSSGGGATPPGTRGDGGGSGVNEGGVTCTSATGCDTLVCDGGVCIRSTTPCNEGPCTGGNDAGHGEDAGAPPHDAAPECTTSAPCDAGKPCSAASDCTSSVCSSGTCAAPSDSDGVENDSETDVDCGGGLLANGQPNAASDGAGACADGKKCSLGTDCVNLVCATGPLTAPSPGGAPVSCPAGASCTCQKATDTDGIQNGGESDVDCGGATLSNGQPNPASDGAPACAVGKKCAVHADCASDGCDYTNHCALGRSCTQHHGGDTCGAGEDTDLGPNPTTAADEESCCTALPVSGTSYTVDKYAITAGRIRAWVTRLDGDLRSFTESIPASSPYWNPEWNQYIPSTESEVDLQLGPYPAPLTPDPYPPTDQTNDAQGLPSGEWLGQWRDGCTMGSPGMSVGARTWWTNYALHGDEAPIQYPQDYLDDKIINCIDAYMLEAFCIWDGGHLATDAEMSAAWGPGPYPWTWLAPNVTVNQTSQEPEGMDSMGRDASSYVSHEFGLTPDEFVAPFTYNYDPYGLYVDNSYHIPAPGRFPLGASPSGHMDLAGTSYEATGITPGTDPSEPPASPPTTPSQSDHSGTLEEGSWEIHPIISGSGTEVMYDPWRPAWWAYWASTGRCGRSASGS